MLRICFFVDLDGNRTPAGSIPYFGGNCTSNNYFTNPQTFPIYSAMNPQSCLPGFVEIYGQGIPNHDSVLQRNTHPSDFKLQGPVTECARLHLDIPFGTVAVLFVVKFNPNQSTVLKALWDCTPDCCIVAEGDTVCAGQNVQLGTDRRAFGYNWIGPNGFTSTERDPVIQNATEANEGWYYLEGTYLFDCNAFDSVYVEVISPQAIISPDTSRICNGETAQLTAVGNLSYVWNQNDPGFVSANGKNANVSPSQTATYTVIGTDSQGCSDTASAVVIPSDLAIELTGNDPSCYGEKNGSIEITVLDGQAPFQIRRAVGPWIQGTMITGLGNGNHPIEVRDANGCTARSTITLDEPEEVTASIGTMPPTCEGMCNGEINIFPMGGTAPYTFRTAGRDLEAEAGEFCAGNYNLEVQDVNGCSYTTSYVVDEPEPFTIDLGRNRKVVEGDSIEIKIKSKSAIESVVWNGLCNVGCRESIMITPDSSLLVSATATSILGCKATDQMILGVKKKAKCGDGVYAANVFTPNGDGLNERFIVYADPGETDVQQIARLAIFNQWGKVVFSANGLPPGAEEYGWDGYSKGNPVPEGNYTWVATFVRQDGLTFDCSGNILVIR